MGKVVKRYADCEVMKVAKVGGHVEFSRTVTLNLSRGQTRMHFDTLP